MGEVKELHIKNQTYYYFDDIIEVMTIFDDIIENFSVTSIYHFLYF